MENVRLKSKCQYNVVSKVYSPMFSIFKNIQPRIIFSLFLNFCQISGSRSFKIYCSYKKSENTVRFAIGCICNWLSFQYNIYVTYQRIYSQCLVYLLYSEMYISLFSCIVLYSTICIT